jgi:hypothetical protein
MYQVNAMRIPPKVALGAYLKAKSAVAGLIAVKFLDRKSCLKLRHF